MSKEAAKPGGKRRKSAGSHHTQGSNPAKSIGDEVEDEYRRIVETLNRGRVSFTARSAEGITLYAGLDSHRANGHMREIARTGHLKLVKRVNKRNQSKLDAGGAPSRPVDRST